MRLLLSHPARLGLIFVVTLLAGCASMTEEECLTADWYERGTLDGRRGQSSAILDQHREACAKVQVIPDDTLFHKGHAIGLRQFCQPENAAAAGHRGYQYHDICPADLHQAFLQRYRPAFRVHQARAKVNSLNSSVNNKDSDLRRELKKERDKDGKGGPDDRKVRSLQRELNDLEYQQRRARDELYQAEKQERELQMEFERQDMRLQMERERHELRMQLEQERRKR